MFNKQKINRLENKISTLESESDVYRERNRQLEEEVKNLKDVELKLNIARMLLEDDEAIVEMLNVHAENKKAENTTTVCYECARRGGLLSQQQTHNNVLAQQQMAAAQAMHHNGFTSKAGAGVAASLSWFRGY